jgi:hypothetical protein
MSDTPAPVLLESAHGPPESWPGFGRGLVCSAGAVAIAWHTPEVSKYALGVLCLVAFPALAKTLVAPLLARVLKV